MVRWGIWVLFWKKRVDSGKQYIYSEDEEDDSLSLREGVARNAIFSWPFLQTIKASKMTENNALVSGLLGEQFKLEMMVPQRAKETPKTWYGKEEDERDVKGLVVIFYLTIFEDGYFIGEDVGGFGDEGYNVRVYFSPICYSKSVTP